MAVGFPRAPDGRERETGRKKERRRRGRESIYNRAHTTEASVVLESNLGSDISSLLLVSTGHTDQPWRNEGGDYPRVGRPGGRITEGSWSWVSTELVCKTCSVAES